MAQHSPEVEFRLLQDAMRAHLYQLDRDDPCEGSRLLQWTIATRQNELSNERRSKFPKLNRKAYEKMARVAGTKNKPKIAKQLSEALAFVSVAGTKDDVVYKQHVMLNNRFAIMSDGQITAGYPITEELECCPKLDLLIAAINKCGDTLVITELENGSLALKGDNPRFVVPCLPFTEMLEADVIAPDPSIAVIDDRIKTAFGVCGVIINERGDRMIETALLLEANVCTGTNGHVLMQYWHGIDLPPNLVVPKIFAAAVCKMKAELVGFGFTPGHSVTLHFKDGSWLKTLLYTDKYPDVSTIINRETKASPVPPGMFDAISSVAEFNKDGHAILEKGLIRSSFGDNDVGAQYDIAGLDVEKVFAGKLTKLIAPFVTSIDLTTEDDRAFFFGDSMRGVIMCILSTAEPSQTSPAEREHFETNDEIPF